MEKKKTHYSPRMEAFLTAIRRQRHEVNICDLRNATDVERSAELKLRINPEAEGYHFDYLIRAGKEGYLETVMAVTVHMNFKDRDKLTFQVSSSRCNSVPELFRVVAQVYEKAANLHRIFMEVTTA